MMFQKILIANRGEIACRIIQTAKKMGIKTVAVYSEADQDARHVELADESVCIGPAPSRESYLVMHNIIAACKATGAQAIHPGYGFLSENEEFARIVEEQGIIFIGPKHHSIAAMGDKIASKKLAEKAKVNTIPGHNEAIGNADLAVDIAKKIGYPVMIKASAGGGGKGLRVAYNDQEAFDGFTSCQNEARNSFGDDRIFIEKFVEEPRHIEIQILGDAFNNIVYLWERECSIQRRHQKVIEEAPSPFISEKTRLAMGEQAVALARAVQYQSAGTVEFVVGKDQSFYFLEMNTRLQVEHPVTEMITGLDLVEQMIRVAAGERLTFGQKDVQRNGWAIECRINAEDPYRQFLPSTGRLVKYQPPRKTDGVRVDTGVYEGGEIPMFYDSMIAKLITHGSTREEAIGKMQIALNQFVIRGIDSNIPFQATLMQHPEFQSGQINTGFISKHFPQGFMGASLDNDTKLLLSAIAGSIHLQYVNRSGNITGQLEGHSSQVTNQLTVVIGDHGKQEFIPIEIEADGDGDHVVIQDKEFDIMSNWRPGEIIFEGLVNNSPIVLQANRQSIFYELLYNGIRFQAMVMSRSKADLQRLMPFKAPPDMSQYLLSPMPGLLSEVSVEVGQKVQVGQKLAVIEAMKMENVMLAQHEGVVAQILAKKGESLSVDQMIIKFDKG
ncbi:acetyl/propionyl-CoA carboxylase subunit alpha [Polynucleobacter sp. SHI8]|nr:acetyl/propionyl-CoA carboxylase subunit alpha [Polynucleobacter sp. SHI2]BDW13516.1 acetyl/propionyl-CoA carboxylase subunit alpha [Polynucleobacter sp. SHI8]